MSNPKDKGLYEKIKKKNYSENPKHSAYRSGVIVKEYKKAYEKKHNSKEAYKGNKDDSTAQVGWEHRGQWKTMAAHLGIHQWPALHGNTHD